MIQFSRDACPQLRLYREMKPHQLSQPKMQYVWMNLRQWLTKI